MAVRSTTQSQSNSHGPEARVTTARSVIKRGRLRRQLCRLGALPPAPPEIYRMGAASRWEMAPRANRKGAAHEAYSRSKRGGQGCDSPPLTARVRFVHGSLNEFVGWAYSPTGFRTPCKAWWASTPTLRAAEFFQSRAALARGTSGGREPFVTTTIRGLKPRGCESTEDTPQSTRRAKLSAPACWWPQCDKSRGYGARAPVITTAGAAVHAFFSSPTGGRN
jgi:hypothetical protein